MELLNTIHDKIWTAVFSFFYPVTDCTPFMFTMIVGLFATLFFIFRRTLLHRTYALGILELPILLSFHYVTEQLPRLHSRIHLALSTTAGIVLQSTDYTREFQTISGLKSLSNASISRYLYYLNNTDPFSEAMPEQLYYHLFKTLRETRGVFGFLQVHKTSIIFLSFVILLLFCLLVDDLRKKNYFHGLFLIILSIFTFNAENGVLLAIFIFIFIECVFMQIFPVCLNKTAPSQ